MHYKQKEYLQYPWENGFFLTIYEMKCVQNSFSLCYRAITKFWWLHQMISLHLFILCITEHAVIPEHVWGGQRPVRRVTSLILSYGSRWSHLDHQSWQHTEPSYWPPAGGLESFYTESLSVHLNKIWCQLYSRMC